MAEARKKPPPTFEEHREKLLSKVPDFMIPFQLGPGVASPTSARELAGQLVPGSEAELAINSLPLGKLFSMVPAPMKRQMITLLRKGENKARIAKKMLEQSPALGKAAEALMMFTGKRGGIPYRPAPGATNIEQLSRSLDELYAKPGSRIVASPIPSITTKKSPSSSPSRAAIDIKAAQEAGLPIEISPKMAAQSGLGGLTNPPTTGPEHEALIRARRGFTDVDVSDLEALLDILAKRPRR